MLFGSQMFDKRYLLCRLDIPFEKYDLNKYSTHSYINKTNGDVSEYAFVNDIVSLLFINFYLV